MAYELPKLPYPANSLEPHIDAETMELHHGKHHAAYVTNLNKALETEPTWAKYPVEDLLKHLNEIPEAIRNVVRNNGGGHANHTMFWEIMKLNGGKGPGGTLLEAIKQSFGTFEEFQAKFNEAGLKQFGSGWVFVVKNAQGKLEIIPKPNQDTPLSEGRSPIMGNDVWEHAYYVKYRNRRADYLAAWWNVVNWDAVQARFEKIK